MSDEASAESRDVPAGSVNPDDSTLLKAQRHDRILALLEQSGQVHASALGEMFGVSSFTVRRDLDELAELGKLQRVHGGAVLSSSVPHTFDERQNQSLEAKRESARAALSLLEPNQVVIVDGGSTAACFVDQIPLNFQATFVTHSPAIASALVARAPAEVIALGGRVDPASRVCVGSQVIESYNKISADLCVLGIWGINPAQGMFSPYYEESLIRQVLVDTADKTVGLAVGEKLGTGGAFFVAPATALTHLALESAVGEDRIQSFKDAGIRILQPGPKGRAASAR